MYWKPLFALLLLLPTAVHPQEIIKLPAGTPTTVSRPDDLFELPQAQWQYAKQLWKGREPCSEAQCEAGYTAGDLVVNAEHAGTAVRIIAGVRNCEATAFSEMETGLRPSKSMRKRVARQVRTVVKGLGKTCKLTMPEIAPLDVTMLFPP